MNSILENSVLVHVKISASTGAGTLTPAMLGLKAGDLPPEDLAKLGQFQAIPKSAFSAFETARRKVEDVCTSVGVKLFGLYLLPKDQLQFVLPEIDLIIAGVYEDKASLLSSRDRLIEEWCSLPEHAKFSQIIRDNAKSAAYLERQIQAKRFVFEICPAQIDESNPVAAVIASSFDGALSDLGVNVLSEVATEADECWKNSVLDRTTGAIREEVTQKILSPIKRILVKLNALSYVDNRIPSVIAWIKGTLSTLPCEGKMKGAELSTIVNLVSALRDPELCFVMSAAFMSGTTTVSAADQQALLDLSVEQSMANAIPVDMTPVADDLDSQDQAPSASPVSVQSVVPLQSQKDDFPSDSFDAYVDEL